MKQIAHMKELDQKKNLKGLMWPYLNLRGIL